MTSWRIRVEISDFHYIMVSDPAGGGSGFSSAKLSGAIGAIHRNTHVSRVPKMDGPFRLLIFLVLLLVGAPPRIFNEGRKQGRS
jgi:hypothetical protein